MITITHTIESYWIPSQKKTKSKIQIQRICQNFWRCLIICANMKWIRQVFLKIQSGHNSVHRRTDGWTRWNQYNPLSTELKEGYNYIFTYIFINMLKSHNMIILIYLFSMFQIVLLSFSKSILALSFYIDIVLKLSILMAKHIIDIWILMKCYPHQYLD